MGLNVNSNANFSAVYNSNSGGGGNWYDGIGASFGLLLNGAGKAGKFAAGSAIGGGGGAGGLAGGGLAGGGTGDLTALLAEQNRLQLEMQTFSMISNISKTEHDSRMNLVRNMRP